MRLTCVPGHICVNMCSQEIHRDFSYSPKLLDDPVKELQEHHAKNCAYRNKHVLEIISAELLLNAPSVNDRYPLDSERDLNYHAYFFTFTYEEAQKNEQ